MKTLLLVDDEPLLRETLAEALGRGLPGAAYDVLTAEDGLRAIEILSRRPVDLIITDLCMPHVDGFGLLAHLDAHHPRLPVIAVTGYGFPDAREFVHHLGARVFFDKPVPVETLAHAVERLLAAAAEESSLHGFSLYGFLQMMELEKKTSLVRVQAGADRRGQLCFERGALVNASVAGSGEQGEAAVVTMLGWREPELRVSSQLFAMPPRNVVTSLATLLMESAHTLDEQLAAADSAHREGLAGCAGRG